MRIVRATGDGAREDYHAVDGIDTVFSKAPSRNRPFVNPARHPFIDRIIPFFDKKRSIAQKTP
ncbi:MAG TPA: hypothetical protein DEB39_17050 [Planctomycetaceae bacterium]|nr:hypothetical protein [Planctomycetaceae bacterium]